METTSPNTNASLPTLTKRRRGGRWAWITSIFLLLAGAALILYPVWPNVEFALTKKQSIYPYTTRLTNDHNSNINLGHLPVVENKPIPTDNRLIIPSIGVDMKILEGPDQKVLDQGGIWRIPGTSDPSKGSNTVLSGHRWMYLPPSNRTLYLLDKVKVGEPVIIYWAGQEYDYRISNREVVDPSRIDIQDATLKPQLTIFTCTPLFSTKQRLVLYGELIS